ITLIVTVWGIVVAATTLPSPSPQAIAAFLRGQELRRAAFAEITGGAERDPKARALMQKSVGDFNRAITLKSNYGAAYFGRAVAPDVRASPDPRGAHGSTAARDDYRRAYKYGYEPPLVLNNLAVTELRLGDYDAAIKAATGAVTLRPRLANYLETLTSV